MDEKNTGQDVELYEKLIKKTTVLMTTIPSREKPVLVVLDSIYDQVDEIRIVFNGYDRVPSWAYKAPKIKPLLDLANILSDCAKWCYIPDVGYVLTIDDDILYPPDYVSTMIDKIEQYERKAVMTVHGSYFKLPYISYGESKRSFRFQLPLVKDVQVPMIGTATLAFHTDTISVAPYIKNLLPNRSDIWFSLICLQNHIPMMCIKREEKWLQSLATDENTLWNMMCADEEFLNENTRLIGKYFVPYISKDTANLCPF